MITRLVLITALVLTAACAKKGEDAPCTIAEQSVAFNFDGTGPAKADVFQCKDVTGQSCYLAVEVDGARTLSSCEGDPVIH